MNAFLFDRLHNGLGKVLDLRAAQHGITASNLANADTSRVPGEVHSLRPDAVAGGRAWGEHGHAAHRGAARICPADAANPEVHEIEPPPWAADGNSVTPEREVVRLNENALMYESVSRGLSKRMAMLKYARPTASSRRLTHPCWTTEIR